MSDIDKLVEEKAQELLKKQKERELHTALYKIVQALPKSLEQLHSAIEILSEEIGTSKEINSKTLNKILEQYDKLNKDVNNIYDKIREIKTEDNEDLEKLSWNIIDRNNPNSFVLQIEKMFQSNREDLIDLNNEKSFLNIIKRSFKEVIGELKKNRNIREIITWILISSLTLIQIVRWLLDGRSLFGS